MCACKVGVYPSEPVELIGVSDDLNPSLAFAGKAEAYHIEASDGVHPCLIFASKAGAYHSKTSYEFHPIKIFASNAGNP